VRLFVGFRPSAEASDHLAEAVDRIRDSQRIPSTAPALRWVSPQRWHVTLAFLGEVDAGRIPRIEEALEEVSAGIAPMTGVRLSGVGTFPGALWAGLSPTQRDSPADRLARAVQHGMRTVGVAVESKPWQAHLTLARWRPGRDERSVAQTQTALDRAVWSLGDYRGPEFDVVSIQLVHSITGPDPRYADLARFRLTRPGGPAYDRSRPAASR